jgi:hypothetical protein
MPRVALPDSYSYARHLGVSTLHMFKDQHYFVSFIVDRFDHYKASSCDAPFKTLLGILGYWMN